jgi:hypothetical protein
LEVHEISPDGSLGESVTRPGWGDDGGMKTRTLMLMALVTGVAILAAFAIQVVIFLTSKS